MIQIPDSDVGDAAEASFGTDSVGEQIANG